MIYETLMSEISWHTMLLGTGISGVILSSIGCLPCLTANVSLVNSGLTKTEH